MNQTNLLPGFFLAIEGIDGAGKTTQAHFVQERLQARRLPTIRTKEPTTGQWGQILRDSALTGRLSLEEEVEIFIKDRREHVETVINPALAAGQIVIADRYYFSTCAYQGARGRDPLELMAMNEAFAPEPDLLVILDIDPQTGLERIRTRGDRANHFETTSTLHRARDIFNTIAKPYKYVVNALLDPKEICHLIMAQLSICYMAKITRHNGEARDKLNATLALFGGDPV